MDPIKAVVRHVGFIRLIGFNVPPTLFSYWVGMFFTVMR